MIQLLKPYQHIREPDTSAVPFHIAEQDDASQVVEFTLCIKGAFSAGAMPVDEFLEQFELMGVN